MPPAGLLAIIALGLVLAYVIPQRVRERGDYALVRTEDRYSADMRVVRSSAERLETPRQRPSSNSGEVPLLVTGQARAQIAALGQSRMSRPAGPLDRAATAAQRERLHLHRDQAGVRAERAARARRRARVAGVALALTVVSWILVAASVVIPVVAALVTAAFVAVLGFGARAAAAERKADARVRRVAREVEAAATATQALRVVARARAEGREVQPSDTATQAIRVVTAEDLAPLAAPAPLPAPEITPVAEPQRVEAEDEVEEPVVEATSPWRPKTMPVPTYALKPAVRPQVARPLSEQDFAASALAAQRAARAEAAAERAAAAARRDAGLADEPTTASGSLDTILARRRANAS